MLILGRCLARHRYRLAASGSQATKYWKRLFTLSAFGTGCLWGLTGFVVLMTALGMVDEMENPLETVR